jgi:hypothetical protein
LKDQPNSFANTRARRLDSLDEVDSLGIHLANKEQDLPKDLVQLSNEHQMFKINWVKGPNTKTMKKVFPVLKFLDDDDIIIYTDDDLIFPSELI